MVRFRLVVAPTLTKNLAHSSAARHERDSETNTELINQIFSRGWANVSLATGAAPLWLWRACKGACSNFTHYAWKLIYKYVLHSMFHLFFSSFQHFSTDVSRHKRIIMALCLMPGYAYLICCPGKLCWQPN